MAALLPQMVVDYQSFVAGTEAVVVGSLLGFVVGTETAVVEFVVDNFDFVLGYIVVVAVVTVELDHYNLIVDFVDSLRVRKPTSYASAHIEYKLQRYT